MKNELSRENLPPELVSGTGLRTALIIVTVLVAGFVFATYSFSSPETSLILSEEAELDRVEGNTLGTVIVRNNALPWLYSRSGLEACIYTSGNSSPVILETEEIENRYLSPNEVETYPVLLDIPRGELDRAGLQRNFTLERRDHCPIRKSPGIVVKNR